MHFTFGGSPALLFGPVLGFTLSAAIGLSSIKCVNFVTSRHELQCTAGLDSR
jgi:hypothetical protein